MSSLNLMPNVYVMVAQMGIFGSTILVIKKTILEPYLRVRAQRTHQTSGKKDIADKLIQETNRKMKELHDKIDEAALEAKEIHLGARSLAQKEKYEILSQAEKQSQEIIEQTKARIREEVEIERAKIPAIVKSLVTLLFEEVTN